MFEAAVYVFHFFYGQWTIFVLASLLGVRWIYEGVTDTVPRDVVGDYPYAGPKFFIVLGVLMQIPLVLRVQL